MGIVAMFTVQTAWANIQPPAISPKPEDRAQQSLAKASQADLHLAFTEMYARGLAAGSCTTLVRVSNTLAERCQTDNQYLADQASACQQLADVLERGRCREAVPQPRWSFDYQ